MKQSLYKGISWFIVSRLFFSLGSAVVKALPYSVFQFNFIRGLFITLAVTPGLWMQGRGKAFRPKDMKLMLIRVSVSSIGLMCFYATFQLMSIAKAVTIASTQTFLTPLLAKIFLGEKVGFYRWLSILVGYLGVWFALDPVHTGIDFPEILAIAHVFLSAGSNILTKKVLATEPKDLTMFYGGITSIFFVVVMFLVDLWWGPLFSMHVWQPISWSAFVAIFFLFGSLGFVGQYGYFKAYNHTEVSLLSPFEYTSFIFGAVLGYLLFNEIPELSTWIAMAFIVLATFLLTAVELSKHKKIARAP